MNLSIYDKENLLRKDYSKITDDHIILFNYDRMNKLSYIPIENKNNIIAPCKFGYRDTEEKNPQLFVDKKDFNKKFHILSGGMLSYIDWTNVVVAGGLASNTINPNYNSKTISDIDLFIYGLNESSAKDKINTIIDNVREYVTNFFNCDLHVMKNKYVISMIPENVDKRCHKVQIILRLYKCVYEILAGFDIDSCAVAYNGSDILMTERSLNSFLTRYNLIDITRRSPSYESRLYKYYKRGFGIYIPFEYNKLNNKMYFVNRNSLGIDKLMYLLNCSRDNTLGKFLNIVTQRINKRVNYKKFSSYETRELVFDEDDIRNTIMNYNTKVEKEFRYKMYNKFSKIEKYIKFITQDPGRQLTGSFNPIENEDWIDVNYFPHNIDFLGRSCELLKIKKGSEIDFYNRIDRTEKPIYDNSMFNQYCYMIFYVSDESKLIEGWDRQNLFAENKNMYNISYIELALLMNRQQLLKYVLEKNKESKTLDNLDSLKLIKMCFLLDNPDLLNLITNYYSIKIQNYEPIIKKFNSLNIANYFCFRIDNYQKQSSISQLKDKSCYERQTYLHNLWHKWGYYSDITSFKNVYEELDYYNLTIDEVKMLNFLENSNRNHLENLCRENVIKNVKCKYIPYCNNTFERYWFDHLLNKLERKEKNKDVPRSDHSMRILREVYSYSDEQVEKLINLDFVNPIPNINPFVFSIMKNMNYGNLEKLEGWKTFYRPNNDAYKHLELYLIHLDNYEKLKQVVKNDLEFLTNFRKKLKTNLLKVLEDKEREKINLEKDNIFRNYAKIFLNNKYHLRVFEEGILDPDYERTENIFGYTPCDYVINKLLYFYNTIIIHDKEIDDDKLKLLQNLRNSIKNIDSYKHLKLITKEQCLGEDIREIISRMD